MPNPQYGKTKYEEWKKLFDRFYSPNLETVVGHSAGAGFILKWLHENPNAKLNKLVLVAPFIDPLRRRGDFLIFDLKKNALKNVKEVHLFISDDDGESIIKSTEQILDCYSDIIVHKYSGLGHFCIENTGTSFEDFWKVM